MSNLDEYKKLGEPEKYEKAQNWQTAIGLQQVDGLIPSQYLIEIAKANIDGDITIAEVKSRLDSYYKEKPAGADDTERTQEAGQGFRTHCRDFSRENLSVRPTEYIGIHKRLFSGIYDFAGKIRNYNITKDK
jgi:hypothetical protein